MWMNHVDWTKHLSYIIYRLYKVSGSELVFGEELNQGPERPALFDGALWKLVVSDN